MQRKHFTEPKLLFSLLQKTEVNDITKDVEYETKRYLHFDNRRKYETVKSYVMNQQMVAEHSFFPLIHYITNSEKYSELGGDHRNDYRPIKTKQRSIMYASHIDNFIYKYYGEKLNDSYNNWCLNNGINDCSIAYRNNKRGKSNIDFAAQVISKICSIKNCYIIIGDFKGFFDNIDHGILKERVNSVLDPNSSINYLEEYWYRILKSVTRYSYYDKETLERELGTNREIKSNRQFTYFKKIKDFRKFKKQYKMKRNKEKFGIPQGTAISAVLANIYTTNFDVMVKKLVANYNGLYRRYSDDYIIVIPKYNEGNIVSKKELLKIEQNINQIIDANFLYIQEEKTGLYSYSNHNIINVKTGSVDKIDYLGFIFDGKNTMMRQRSVYNFYRRAKKLIDKEFRVKKKKGLDKLPYRKLIYELYTDKGTNRRPYGNFITYAMKSQSIFDELSPNTNNLMMNQINNRKSKIEKRL